MLLMPLIVAVDTSRAAMSLIPRIVAVHRVAGGVAGPAHQHLNVKAALE
jgi:hypothetical protein